VDRQQYEGEQHLPYEQHALLLQPTLQQRLPPPLAWALAVSDILTISSAADKNQRFMTYSLLQGSEWQSL
jgi:hypothetical protein